MRGSTSTGQTLWLVAALATGCATPGVVRGPSPSAPSLLGAQWTGTASWYGEPHHGRPTASGEAFDKARLTAAHRRSEEHTSELQSLTKLVCRLLLEKKK